MRAIIVTPRFERDVRSCKKKHWDIDSLKRVIEDLANSDKAALPAQYKDHALAGALKGFRGLHVDSAPNPPRDKWVLLYEIQEGEIHLLRTGTHDEVYGKTQ